jgi:hypothetical protein
MERALSSTPRPHPCHRPRFWFQEYQPGPVSRDRYEHRPGVLGGQDALPPAVLTTADALAKCTAQANCTGITFESDATRSSETPVKTWFKAAMLTDGAVGWHSWVQLRRPSHHHLPRFYQQTEANAGEYDIPPAFRRRGDPPIVGYPHLPISAKGDLHLTPGTTCTGACPDGDDCECEHTITMHWTMSNARMLYAGGHCHAPSCIDIRLYRNDTGTPELLCRQTSTYGEGAVRKDKFDEAGYIVLPVSACPPSRSRSPAPASPPSPPPSAVPVGGCRRGAGPALVALTLTLTLTLTLAVPVGRCRRGAGSAFVARPEDSALLDQAQPQHACRPLWRDGLVADARRQLPARSRGDLDLEVISISR